MEEEDAVVKGHIPLAPGLERPIDAREVFGTQGRHGGGLDAGLGVPQRFLEYCSMRTSGPVLFGLEEIRWSRRNTRCPRGSTQFGACGDAPRRFVSHDCYRSLVFL